MARSTRFANAGRLVGARNNALVTATSEIVSNVVVHAKTGEFFCGCEEFTGMVFVVVRDNARVSATQTGLAGWLLEGADGPWAVERKTANGRFRTRICGRRRNDCHYEEVGSTLPLVTVHSGIVKH